MAVTLRRVGMAGLVLIALILPTLKKGPPAPRSESEERTQRLRQLQGALDAAVYRWSALNERDSALALSAGVSPGQRPRIILRGFPAGARSEVAEEMVISLWKQLGPTDPTVSVSLVLYNGEGYSQRFGSYAGTSVQFDGPGTRCVAVMTGELRSGGSVRVWKESLRYVLAPCLLVAGFGPPGKGIQRWLEATRFGMAASADWLLRPKDFLGGDGSLPWRPQRDFYAGLEGSSFASRGYFGSLAENLAPPYSIGGVGLRCLDGDSMACRAGVIDTVRPVRVGQELPSDLTVNEWRDGGSGREFLEPVQVAAYWVSDLIRDQGRDKFRRFWTSDLALDEAFQASFGESLGSWTARWAKRVWEGSWQAKHENASITLGTNLAPSWPLVVAGWSALILVGAGWAANRRQST